MCSLGSSAPTALGTRCRRWRASTPIAASRSSRWTGHARMARHPASPMASPPKKREVNLVARLSTVRRRVRLADPSGVRLAEVVDDEVSVRDGRRVAARFREIDVEVPDRQTALDPLVSRLRGAGAGAPDPTPKHVRALGPRAMEPPEVSPLPVLPGAAAKEVIRSVLAQSVAHLLRHDPIVRTGGDPEAVHQARVAI